MIDSDAKVRDERMRSEVGLDVLCDQKLGRYKDGGYMQLRVIMKFEKRCDTRNGQFLDNLVN